VSEPVSAPAIRYTLTFIFITTLVDTIGVGIIIPVSRRLITEAMVRSGSWSHPNFRNWRSAVDAHWPAT
jgi:hypothetical protein